MKTILTCLLLIASVQLSNAQALIGKAEFKIYTGYDRQNLDWSIAGNLLGQNPDVLSELKFSNLGGPSIGGELQHRLYKGLYLQASFSRTSIKSGTVIDNDYAGDGRTQQVYNQTFNADKGFVAKYSAGVGYAVYNTASLSVLTSGGYVINDQSFYLLDRTGNFPDLNSTYHPTWKGAYLSAEARFKVSKKLKAATNITYDQVSYNAKADWNLIQTFVHPLSYRHTAKGYGIEARASMSYAIAAHIAIGIMGGLSGWHTGKGIDELYLVNGSTEKTQFNGANSRNIYGNLFLAIGF